MQGASNATGRLQKFLPCISNIYQGKDQQSINLFLSVTDLNKSEVYFAGQTFMTCNTVYILFYSYAPTDKGSKSENCPQMPVPAFEDRDIILSFSLETRSKYTVITDFFTQTPTTPWFLGAKALRYSSILQLIYNTEFYLHLINSIYLCLMLQTENPLKPKYNTESKCMFVCLFFQFI